MKTLKLPNYHSLGLIGKGQFGEVYCAYDYLQRDLVAIKVIEVKRFSTQQFLRELRFLVSLNHPHIVSCQGLKHYHEQRYLVMDYCEGGSLRDLINRGNLRIKDSLQIIIDILSGLAHTHARQIVHCDLKPENILLSLIPDSWSAKISDFGIAKAMDEKYYSVSLGDTGSPAYMAPERFYGKFSPASDLYAVGIILYELIVGERPFSGTPSELITAHLNQHPVIPESVPFFLKSIIVKALEKLPQHRFVDAQAMLDGVTMALEIVRATDTIAPVYPSYKFLENINKYIAKYTNSIINIAGKNRELYLLQNNQIITATAEVTLPDSVVSLTIANQGCLAWCRDRIYSINDGQFNLLLQLDSSICLTSNQERWFSLVHNSNQPELILCKLNGNIMWRKYLQKLPQQLITLDNHHGLLIYLEENHQTRFTLFNRRGNCYDGFSLNIICKDLVSNPYHPYLLLGKEGNWGVLIQLQPLKISRFTLEFRPDFIIPQQKGFVLASRQGMMIFVDTEGKIIGRYQLNKGEITAIAPVNAQEIVIAISLDSVVTINLINTNLLQNYQNNE